MYLSGAMDAALVGVPGMGFMLTLHQGNRVPDGVAWAADNGCFSAAPDVERQVRFLARHAHAREWCLFAVLPDVLDDPLATAFATYRAIDRLHATGYPLAYVLQPGARVEHVPWAEVRAVFVGGGDARWKFSAEALNLVREARQRGLWTHCGRVNTRVRLLASRAAGFDSVDGNTIGRAPDRYMRLIPRWTAEAAAQLALFPLNVTSETREALRRRVDSPALTRPADRPRGAGAAPRRLISA
jgi:hypothetical protein